LLYKGSMDAAAVAGSQSKPVAAVSADGVSSQRERTVNGDTASRMVAGGTPTASVITGARFRHHHHRQQQQQQQMFSTASVSLLKFNAVMFVVLDPLVDRVGLESILFSWLELSLQATA